MSNIYYYHLDDISKSRYLDKLEYNGVTLPDPLDTDLRLRLYKSRNSKTSPSITFGDIYIYLVEIENTYSRDEFKNYKNLDCYSMILNKKVRDILGYKCDNTEMCVLTCDVESEQTIAKLYRAWAVISSDGMIQNGHCTCMKGQDKVCCHVAALLLSLEIAIKKDFEVQQTTETSFAREEFSNPPKKVVASVFPEIGKKNYVYVEKDVSTSGPFALSKKKMKEDFETIRKLVPNAPIFTSLSDSDFSSAEEEIEDDRIRTSLKILSS